MFVGKQSSLNYATSAGVEHCELSDIELPTKNLTSKIAFPLPFSLE